MANLQNPAEEISDSDEFSITTDLEINIETAQQRLKEFVYYIVENVEFNLNFCLHLLEERPLPARPTSIHVTALSLLCSAIPNLPKWVGSALKTGETTIFRKIEKKNSRILADLVYYFSDHKLELRETIIDAALEVFSNFEIQFMKLTCNGGEKRAMQKLAIDASDRIFNYFLMTEQNREITKTEIIKGIIYGDSKRNKKGIKEGKQVSFDETKWKTSKLYAKVGIIIRNNSNNSLFYKTDNTNPKKYGYRKIFSWENPDEIMKSWILDDHFEIPNYYLEITDDLKQTVKNYIMTKNPHEDAKLEMKQYHEQASDDRETKHDELLKMLKDRFKELLAGVVQLMENVSKSNEETIYLLETVTKNQEEDSKKQEEVFMKLSEVHVDVKETKQTQEVLVKNTEGIQTEITSIKVNQQEMALEVVKQEDIAGILNKDKEGTKEAVKEVFRETLRDADPSNRIKAELKRTEKIVRAFIKKI